MIRILEKSTDLLGLEQLGLAPNDLEQIRRTIRQPNGILLAAGPTGSGRTTFLYNCLEEIAKAENQTFAVEEHIEHVLPYVTPIQLNQKAGLTLAAALRALMRQDPDILFIEEIRDLETAQLAVMLSMTGHLVLSQIYAAGAAAAIGRLIEMGADPIGLAASVIGVVGMRLARTLCANCKEPFEVEAEELRLFGLEPPKESHTVTLWRGRGCVACRMKGFRGRVGIYEVMPMNEAVAELIVRRAPPAELREAARADGMKTLQEDGLRKVLAGVTTPDEVYRVTSMVL